MRLRWAWQTRNLFMDQKYCTSTQIYSKIYKILFPYKSNLNYIMAEKRNWSLWTLLSLSNSSTLWNTNPKDYHRSHNILEVAFKFCTLYLLNRKSWYLAGMRYKIRNTSCLMVGTECRILISCIRCYRSFVKLKT